jgi:ribose-phosphate pyrophosphokinase
MKIYTPTGSIITYTKSVFPDGQTHIILDPFDNSAREATIEAAIRNPYELFSVMLMSNTLYARVDRVNLDIRYLMGARMDRAIDSFQPETLRVVSYALGGANPGMMFDRVRILDPHSSAAPQHLAAQTVLPYKQFFQCIQGCLTSNLVIVVPDKGAVKRVEQLAGEMNLVYCKKDRDPQTGRLSGFRITGGFPVYGVDCLIVDDICDGGGTFSGLAKLLLDAGAKSVRLFVTHGIFSKGTKLDGIDHIYTTDSYAPRVSSDNLTVYPVNMRGMESEPT